MSMFSWVFYCCGKFALFCHKKELFRPEKRPCTNIMIFCCFCRQVMWSVVGHIIPAPGRLVNVSILEPSNSKCPGVGICHTIIGLGLRMTKKLNLELTLQWMKEDELHMVRNGRVWAVQILVSQPLSEFSCFLPYRSQYRVGISPTLNKRQKNPQGSLTVIDFLDISV